jgi:hypothetical protein
MTTTNALKSFKAYTDPLSSGRLVCSCALGVADDVHRVLDSTADSLEPFAATDSVANLSFFSLKAVGMKFENEVLEPDIPENLEDDDYRQGGEQIIDRSEKMCILFRDHAARLIRHRPQLAEIVDQAFHAAAGGVLGLNNLEGHRELKDLVERVVAKNIADHKARRLAGGEDPLKIFETFCQEAMSKKNGLGLVISCMEGIAYETMRLALIQDFALFPSHRAEIQNAGVTNVFDRMVHLSRKILQRNTGLENEEKPTTRHVLKAARGEVEHAIATFEEYQDCAARIAKRCPKTGQRLATLLQNRAHIVFEGLFEGQYEGIPLAPETLMTHLIARHVRINAVTSPNKLN